MEADENAVGPDNGRVTSWLAALANADRSGGQRYRVLLLLHHDALRGGEGMTDETMQALLSMNANSQRPRRIELEQWGFIEMKDDLGVTRCGNKAQRFVITDKGRRTVNDRQRLEQRLVVSL